MSANGAEKSSLHSSAPPHIQHYLPSNDLPKDGERQKRLGEEHPQPLKQMLFLISTSPTPLQEEIHLIFDSAELAKEDLLECNPHTDGIEQRKVRQYLQKLFSGSSMSKDFWG